MAAPQVTFSEALGWLDSSVTTGGKVMVREIALACRDDASDGERVGRIKRIRERAEAISRACDEALEAAGIACPTCSILNPHEQIGAAL